MFGNINRHSFPGVSRLLEKKIPKDAYGLFNNSFDAGSTITALLLWSILLTVSSVLMVCVWLPECEEERALVRRATQLQSEWGWPAASAMPQRLGRRISLNDSLVSWRKQCLRGIFCVLFFALLSCQVPFLNFWGLSWNIIFFFENRVCYNRESSAW